MIRKLVDAVVYVGRKRMYSDVAKQSRKVFGKRSKKPCQPSNNKYNDRNKH